jgi:hypothetical protein
VRARLRSPADAARACSGRQAQLDHLRADIRAFRERTGVERVVVLWTANTERYSQARCSGWEGDLMRSMLFFPVQALLWEALAAKHGTLNNCVLTSDEKRPMLTRSRELGR